MQDSSSRSRDRSRRRSTPGCVGMPGDFGLREPRGTALLRGASGGPFSRLRAAMPILVLSARHSEQETVQLLNAGADDYVTKPFSIQEFAARVRAQLRRSRLQGERPPAQLTTPDGLTVDVPRRAVSRDGERIRLTPTEWEILQTLVRQAGRTLTHQQIFDAVWKRAFGSPQQYLRVHITNLRRKIELDPTRPQIIVTDPG